MYPKDGSARNQAAGERGSVLVVVVGVLAILAMMAATFVAAMMMQKAVGVNVKNSVHAEMAVHAGLTDALARIKAHYDDDGVEYTALTQDWFTNFRDDPAAPGAPEDVVYGVLPAHFAAEPYPDDHNVHNGKSKWFSYEIPNSGGMTARYAVITLDLEGRFCLTGIFTEAEKTQLANMIVSRTSADIGGGILMADPVEESPGHFVGKPRSYSWMHAQHLYAAPPAASTYWSLVSPFGDNYELALGKINVNTAPTRVLNSLILYTTDQLAGAYGLDGMNAMKTLEDLGKTYGHDDTTFNDLMGNSCPAATTYDLDLAKALFASVQSLHTTPKSLAEIKAAFLAYLNVNNPPTTHLIDAAFATDAGYNRLSLLDNPGAPKMETALNDALYSLFGEPRATRFTRTTPTIDYDGPQGGTTIGTPQLHTGKSSFFYVAVVGQCLNNSGKIICERNCEEVIQFKKVEVTPGVYETKSRILYRRWFTFK